MKAYKKILLGAISFLSLGAAIVTSAQDSSFSPEAKLLFDKILGGGTPTTTEGILESLLDQQKKIRDSGSIIEVEPESPGPREEVKVRFVSYSFDVDSSHITWTHNGKKVLSGRGEKTYRFTTGSAGAREAIAVSIITLAGEEFNVSKVFVIGDVDLLWSADVSIPPEYGGKALSSPRSLITVTAVPQFVSGGRTISPASLIYEWNIDGKIKTSKSGSGKRTFSFYASVAAGVVHEVGLKVYNGDKTIVANKSVSIMVHDPEVLIYEEEVTGGPNVSRAITNFKMFPGEEKKFRALPYFSSEHVIDLSFKWAANNDRIVEDKIPDVLRVKLANDAAGVVNVSVLIESVKNIVQRAEASFVINIL